MATSYSTTNRAGNSGWSRKNNEYLRIVMVGKTGAGKSATGNTILGRKFFESKLSATSMTVDCSKGRAEVDGQKVAVIDTPGLFDTRFDKEETAQHLSQCISFAAPGPHVFLVIVRLVDRYTEEEKRTVQRIQELFGEAADKYSMVLFTHGDQLDGTTMKDFLGGCPDLQELVARCNGQYHVFNNKELKDRSQVTELLQKIREICRKNTGSYYTNEMFKQAERAVEEKKHRVLKENEEQRRKEIEKLERKYEEKLSREMEKFDKKLRIQRDRLLKEREKERRMEKQEMYRELKRERQDREADMRRVREEKDREMYKERQREKDEREAEMRRMREEKEREVEILRMKMFQNHERQLIEERERLQNRHDNDARVIAEESNPFFKIVKAGKKVVDGVVDIGKAFKSLFF